MSPHNLHVRVAWVCLAVVVALGGCRRKPAVAPVEAVQPEVAPPPAAPPVAAQVPFEDPLPPVVAVRGHAPTSDEIRARLKPLFGPIGRCMTREGSVKSPDLYLQFRFIISPNGSVVNAQVIGHDVSRNCINEVMHDFHVEPWDGTPSIIMLPITHEGQPVAESTFTDGGAPR